ncbi:MAG: phage portal protein [Planctomycetaceae bacterium]
MSSCFPAPTPQATMLSILRDKLSTFGLKARYERLIHERLLQFTESSQPQSVEEDPGQWQLAGAPQGLPGLNEPARRDMRSRARQLSTHNPHARNILRLLEAYVAGPGLKLTHQPRELSAADDHETQRIVRAADQLWQDFTAVNHTHYSYREHARRAWRDGECFVRKFASQQWPPAVRFVDPERIGPTADDPETAGILTAEGDVESPVSYLLLNLETARLQQEVPAEEMLHTRVGVDSNQKRGVTIFAPVLDVLDCYDQWMKTELTARKLQSSIVLWRKVQGSPQQANAMADSAASGAGMTGDRRERLRPGTILTTNHATEIQFLQPQTNFGDAVPLGRMLLLATAAGAGLPEFMLTADASNANYASTMVAEGPAVKLFQSEQAFFAAEYTRLWRWIMADAVATGRLPTDLFDRLVPDWSFPQLVNRDRPRERLADVRLVETHILSRAEVARREGTDPQRMQREIAGEAQSDAEDNAADGLDLAG